MSNRDSRWTAVGRRWLALVFTGAVGALVGSAPAYAQGYGWGEMQKQFPNQGGQSPANTPNDFWHGIVCTECHAQAPTKARKRGPVVEASKFWKLHEGVKEHREVAPKAGKYVGAKVRLAKSDEWRRYLDYLMQNRKGIR